MPEEDGYRTAGNNMLRSFLCDLRTYESGIVICTDSLGLAGVVTITAYAVPGLAIQFSGYVIYKIQLPIGA